MRIVFMGTTVFSNVVLQQLIDDGYDVVGVVTQPDRKVGRKRVLTAPLTKQLAEKYKIPVYQPEKIRHEYQPVLDFEPDVIVTCAYGQIIPKEIIDYPKYKCLNVHASLLPKYRGGAPIHKAIINGEDETGVTLMHMDVGMDTGDMLAMRSVPIDVDDTFGDVEAKLMVASKTLMHVDFKDYIDGKLNPIKQNDVEASYAYAIKRSEEFVSFKGDIDTIYNHIRGLIPWPVGYGMLEETLIKFHGVQKFIKENDKTPGEILKIDETGVHVAVQGGIIVLTQVQPANKPKMQNQDVMNGFSDIWVGKVFD